MSKYFGSWTGTELLHADFPNGKPLIENLIYEHDNVLLVGREKANKSTLVLQMMCALSSGEPLFEEFEVPASTNSVYVQAEGKIQNTKSNFENMRKAVPNDPERMRFIYRHALPLDTQPGFDFLLNEITKWGRKVDVVFIDPLYQSMSGDLRDQQDASKMTANLRLLQGSFECTIVLVHHGHRPIRDERREVVDEGDDATFGSFVWKAWPDTVLLMERTKGHKNLRRLSCDTQRMGNVVESVELVLVEPSPFCLQLRGEAPIDKLVFSNLDATPKTIEELSTTVRRHRNHVSIALRRLIESGVAACCNPDKKPLGFVRLR